MNEPKAISAVVSAKKFNMTHMDAELAQLKESINEMMMLVKAQFEKAKIAFTENNTEIAEEIIRTELRVNAVEISIDRDIENIFALFHPVASDLRFVISMLKINSDLERIGDYADGIAEYVVDLNKAIPQSALERTHTAEMFDVALSMMTDIRTAYEKGDTKLARKVYKKDKELNELNRNASKVISEMIAEDTSDVRSMLYLFSAIRKIERAGDHIKNIADDIIFHHEAAVLKHKNKKDPA